MLSPVGMPPQITTVIREFNDGMEAYVRSSDGSFLKPFDVNQGLRQEGVLSLLLFNIFIAVVLLAVLQTFSEDAEFLPSS